MSFTRAAEDMGVSQPTLTRQVRALETDYGVTLFERNTRRLRLTQEGWQLLELARGIFKGLDSAEDFLRSQNARSVRLHSVQHAGISDILLLYYKYFPRYRFDVEIARSSQVLASLLNRECDFGVLTIAEAPPEIDYFTISSGHIIVLVGDEHAWRSRSSISIRELVGQRVIVASRSGQSRRMLDDHLAQHGVTLSIVQVVDSNEIVWDLVRKGAGIGVIGNTGLVDQMVGHHLVLEEQARTIDVHFACRKERLRTEAFSRMFRLVRAMYEGRVPGGPKTAGI
jgi:LysR family transcriptional regulator, low CO2-responsive transcriptional regulator